MRLTFTSRCISAAVALLCAGSLLNAQTPAATPASGMKKSFSMSDKTFIKNIAEAELGMLHLTELTHWTEAPGSEELKKMNTAIASDLDKAWGELATVAGKNAELPKTEPSSTEKISINALKKTDKAKFDKPFLKSLAKEAKKASQVAEAQGKNVQDPDLKQWVTKWAPVFKTHADEVAKADAEKK